MSQLSRRRVLPVAFLIALTTGLFVFKSKQDEAIIRGHFGDRTFNVLRTARSTEVVRLYGLAFDDMTEAQQKQVEKILVHYPVKYQEKDQGEEFTNRLSRLLQKRRPFYKLAARSLWWPEIAFRMRSDNDAIIIFVSFNDNRLEVFHGPFDTNPSAQETLHFMRPQLVKLAREAFPSDKEIQALTEEQ
jgi:hypothetical protein